ncbi:MAG: hypothetical protein QOI28_710, partial [Mycobacterium sp.]|nr:hypothetical protein [Mycobacterium sp.]
LVDHGDACLALATVLGVAGDTAGARAAAERAVALYELKGAAALAEQAGRIVGERQAPPARPEAPSVEIDNACLRVGSQVVAAVNREAWDEVAQLFAPHVALENRRKIVGFPRIDLPSGQWPHDMRRYFQTGLVRYRFAALAVRGERLALVRMDVGTADLSSGAPEDEMLQVIGLDAEGVIALQVSFDVEDRDAAMTELDAAHARLGEQHRSALRLENAASRADAQFNTLFTERRWEDIGCLLTANVRVEDRRRGLRRESNDRATLVAEAQAAAALGVTSMASEVIAIRAQRLALVRTRFETAGPDAFFAELFRIVEVDDDGLIVAAIMFDPDDIDAAIAELDARYLAGEAAAHAHTWSVIASGFAALNRREIPATSRDWVNIDHRRSTSFEPGDLPAYIRSLWEVASDVTVYIQTVHRLSDFGALVSSVTRGSADEGFDAEWRELNLLTRDGELVSRIEFFDEADLNAALAKFDEVSRPAKKLENTASNAGERFLAYFASRDWDAMAEMLADDYSSDDRRRVVSAGVRQGRDAEILNMRAIEDLWITNVMATVIAIRGGHLTLMRTRYSGRDQGPEVYLTEILGVIEINTDDRISSLVVFDPDDLDAAFEELDTRYLAGEAAPYAHTWSLIARASAAFNRHVMPPTTPDWINIDHRKVTAFAPGDMTPYMRATMDVAPDIKFYIEAVHRLSNLGAVFTQPGRGISHEGFEAEWRDIILMSIEGDQFNRCEIFDEADVDAAIARFDELSRPAPQLENAASRVYERSQTYFTAGDWDALAAALADKCYTDDRRRVVGAGVRHGPDAAIEDSRAIADVGLTNMSTTVIATRGQRLALTRAHYSGTEPGPEAFHAESLGVVEIDADHRIAAVVVFELDDIDAAFEELDARYLAGEAADHAQTWSVITRAFAAVNRHEVPPTAPDWVDIDHRRGAPFGHGDLAAIIATSRDITPDLSNHVECVHLLNDFGALFTQISYGSSYEGFGAEWRMLNLVTIEGDLMNRCELFDEADGDSAFARFEELQPRTPRLENAASQVVERIWACFMAREWHAIARLLAQNVAADDRRRVVNSGALDGRDSVIAAISALAEVGVKHVVSEVIAIRGEHLVLSRTRSAGSERPEAFHVDALDIVEIDAHERIASHVAFDVDDIDAALEELDARYLAGEAAPHAHTWSVIARGLAAFNRRELPGFTPDS